MPGTGNYPTPFDPLSNVASEYLTSVDQALVKLRDNNTEDIDPKDIRDSVWTLWNRVDDAILLASQSISISGSSYFRNVNPTTIAVGGIPVGSTFGASQSLQEMFDMLLYPYTAPVPSLSISGATTRQYGGDLATTLAWNVTKKKLLITGISVNSTTITPVTGVDQSGTLLVTATHSLNYNTVSGETQTFSMNVTDGQSTPSASTTLLWRHRMYWGKVDLSSISNPNLTTTPGQANTVATKCTDTIIKALNGASVSPGWSLTNSYVKNLNSINGAGQYIIIAFPTIFSSGRDPVFKVNGAPNSAFTKVRTNSPLSTEFGLTINYDVWVSNTAQNAAIDVFDIT